MKVWVLKLGGSWGLDVAPRARWLRIAHGTAPQAGGKLFDWWRLGPVRLRRFVPAAEVLRWRPPPRQPEHTPEYFRVVVAFCTWLEALVHYGLDSPMLTESRDTSTTHP